MMFVCLQHGLSIELHITLYMEGGKEQIPNFISWFSYMTFVQEVPFLYLT